MKQTVHPLLANGHPDGNKTIKYILIACIILVTVSKLSLMGEGFLGGDPDEFRYKIAGLALKDFSQLKIKDGFKDLFSTQGRPGDAIIRLIPNAFQVLTAAVFKLNHYESRNSYPLFLFNFIVYCSLLVIYFRLSRLLLKDDFLALVSVLLYSTLTNSHIYLRHALSYDISLLIFFHVLYKIAQYTEEDRLTYKRSFFTGLFSFFGYLVYPGYFVLMFVTGFLLFFNKLTKENARKKFSLACVHVSGAILCLLVFEAMSRIGGRSYIGDARTLSETILQGTFSESFSFIVKYLYEVEGITGIVVMLSMIVFFVLIASRLKNKLYKEHSTLILLCAALLLAFLAYASGGYFFHKMVFYGRLLHQYFPFMCIFSVFALNALFAKLPGKKEVILAAMSFIFIANFAVNLVSYKSVAYYTDVSWKLLQKNDVKDIDNLSEYSDFNTLMLPENGNANLVIPPPSDSSTHKVILVNGYYIFPVKELSKYHPIHPDSSYKLVYSKPYFLNYKAYQFEAFTIEERSNLSTLNLQIKVYTK